MIRCVFRKDFREAKEIALEWGVYESLQHDWRLGEELGDFNNNPGGIQVNTHISTEIICWNPDNGWDL